jgi:ABC-type sugar transport system permease subunit
VVSLQAWLVPHNGPLDWRELLQNPAASAVLWNTLAYAAVVAFLEPFYVAAGFGMYVNRRVELEAWDIEQEFRRAFAG